ncbi:MAG: ABC transporter permease subunit [Conexivisphaerales archaeon]
MKGEDTVHLVSLYNTYLIFKKDWMEISRNWQVLIPVIVVPVFFSMALPLIIYIFPLDVSSLGPLQNLFNTLPDYAKQRLESLSPGQLAFYMVSVFFFAPFFLVIPLIASSVIASDSFAGEKERKTIESLLATPISDHSMFLGKMLVSFSAAMFATLGSFLVYAAVVDVLALGIFGKPILPDISWLILIFMLAPAVSLASVGLTVTISAKVKGFREAQQINAILIIPILIGIFSEAWITVILGPEALLSLTLFFVCVDVAMFYIGVKLFKREDIMAKLT